MSGPTTSASPDRSLAGAGAHVGSIWRFDGRHRVLHLTWFAFFLTFVVWFNMAPFINQIGDQLGLTKEQKVTLALCNVALTVPARLLIGMALDRWGPRRIFSAILVYAAIPCTAFALSTTFPMLVASRLALSIVGAGFVVGIRMVSEWFPPKEVGLAEGVYGGWGNFGSAAAALALPSLAAVVGGDDGWRWAIGLTGVISAIYGLAYLRSVADTPEGRSFARPRRQGALEVTSRSSVHGLAGLTVPLVAVLAVIVWRVNRVDVVSDGTMRVLLVAIAALGVFQLRQVYRVNAPVMAEPVAAADQYPFRSVVVLCIAYFCTFGSELAVVSMLPAFYADTWGLSATTAGMAASGFAVMNLLARPVGGVMSDLMGSRRRTLATLMAGLALGYAAMAAIGSSWPVLAAVAATMCCSFFVQSAEGATFAIVPLVKKRVSGQIAGLVGAYGNVGAITFLTTYLFVGPSAFFVVIGAAALVGLSCTRWLVEPASSFDAELLTDQVELDLDADLETVVAGSTVEVAPAVV